MTSILDDKLSKLLGGRSASGIEKAFGLSTVGEFLTHYPRRYAKRGELTALALLPIGVDVTIVAEVRSASKREMTTRRGTLVEATISDGTGYLSLTFFNQAWRLDELVPGRRGIFAGKVTAFKGALQLAHPTYTLFDAESLELAELTGAGHELDDESARRYAETPIPIYPATSSLTSWKLQSAMAVVLDSIDGLEEPIPASVRSEKGLLTLQQALEKVHRPETDADFMRGRETLRFHEAYLLQLALLDRRDELRKFPATARRSAPGGLRERFDASLPFSLTGEQTTVGAEIDADLVRDWPMSRLVQGEVGSGKTLVALRAMLTVAESGGQSALLAPTEVLAGQHLRSIVRSLGPDLAAELQPTLLTGGLGAAERRKAMLRIAAGSARIVIGTHALLGDRVQFADLGLVVVDEQHRFGVEQREALRTKSETSAADARGDFGRPPHVLVLTATPIPRTVAMTVFGDLDTSTIRELPAGRPGISSFVVDRENPVLWNRTWSRAVEEIAKGRQVYVVCPAIEPSGASEEGALPPEAEPGAEGAAPVERPAPIASVTDVLALLKTHPQLGQTRMSALHGRMPSEEKDTIMRAFAAGEIDVLVSTTVIEVGVDVPNASTMVILDAERFGVSQLHQLRGRIGRGGVPGICLFVTRALPETVARERVDAVAATLDGFELAEIDLELRREGNVLGQTQSGARSSLRLLRVVRDAELIREARDFAERTLLADPGLVNEPHLRAALRRRLEPDEQTFLAKT